MTGPFKMKGSPMQRNFGIGSPMRDDSTKTTTKDKFKAAWEAFKDVGSASADFGDIGDQYAYRKAQLRKEKATGKKQDLSKGRDYKKPINYLNK